MGGRNLKVVYFLSSSNKYGGANKSFMAMLDGLIKQGVKPVVITTTKNGGLNDIFESIGVDYFFVKYLLNIYPPLRNKWDLFLFFPRMIRTLFNNYFAIMKTERLIKMIKPDIIHSNVGPLHIGYSVAKRNKIPHVWHIREYQDRDFDMHPLFSMNGFKQKLALPNNYCVAITKGLFEYFNLGNKDSLIYNGALKINETVFNPQKRKYFLFAGRLEPNKGIGVLIEIFAEFARTNRDYVLLIAGDTKDEKYKKILQQIVVDADLEHYVSFLGMREDIYSLMESATALIVPSICEAFGRITVEAMFNGCLVIGNNSGGTKEILERHSLGLLYNEQTDLLLLMKQIVDKGIESYFPIIRKAQTRAVELYSIEQNQRLILDLYNKII